VAGATQAGKTTLLSALAAAIPARERVITCEEAQVRYTRSKLAIERAGWARRAGSNLGGEALRWKGLLSRHNAVFWWSRSPCSYLDYPPPGRDERDALCVSIDLGYIGLRHASTVP